MIKCWLAKCSCTIINKVYSKLNCVIDSHIISKNNLYMETSVLSKILSFGFRSSCT